MSQWLDSQKKKIGNIRQLQQERIEKADPRRNLTAEEAKRLNKLDAIANKLKRGKNVQNRQLQTWLNDDEYAKIEEEWKEQLELREDLKNKPNDTKRSCETRRFTLFVLKAIATKVNTPLLKRSTTRVKAFASMH
jgi:hypothetical protein